MIKTKDGLGHIYEAIANGECVCYFARANCPKHSTIQTSIYSTSTSSREATLEEIKEYKEKKKDMDEMWDLLRTLKKGAPLESSEYAKQNGVFKTTRYGNLLGFCKDGRSIRVRLHGNKSSYNYWVGFWKPKDDSFISPTRKGEDYMTLREKIEAILDGAGMVRNTKRDLDRILSLICQAIEEAKPKEIRGSGSAEEQQFGFGRVMGYNQALKDYHDALMEVFK